MLYLPRTRSEAKRWNFLNRQDFFFPIRSWPLRLQRLGIIDHLKNQERLTYLAFLINNGVPPDRALQFIYYGRSFDMSARRQIWYLSRNVQKYPYSYWDMTERRYIKKVNR